MTERIDEMTVGELARVAGVTVRLLHHYDEIGLLRPAHVAANGYRYYRRAEAERLQEILALKAGGVPLDEIGAMLDGKDRLARLIAQAGHEGGELITLRAIVEEASELGANRVLDRLGLGDPSAQEDIDELRELLGAWRDAKASAWKAAVDWLVKGVLALLLVGIAVRLGVGDMLS